MKATFNNKTLAESDKTVVVENNHYFPPSSVNMEYLKKSGNTYQCSWKGKCDYYTVEVDGKKSEDAAFIYAEPTEEAKEIKGHFAFWKEVKVVD